MDDTQKRTLTSTGAIIGVVVLVIAFGILFMSRKHEDSALTATKFASSYAPGSDSVLANYTGQTSPNADAVKQTFVAFDPASLSLPQDIKTNLNAYLSTALDRQVAPSQGTVYIQIVGSTIHCPNSYDCSFSFYIDSPESYFAYHLFYGSDGTQKYTLKQLALPGASS
jgi:hypothetical protein